ncbi:MAG: ZrgA family zinc uptake protein [Deefgea sp.]
MKKLLVMALLSIPAIAAPHSAHVHGVAEMDVVVDGKKVLITLASPADNLLGFERAPKSDYEKNKVKDVNAQLQFAANLFALNAECKSAKPVITMPSFGQGEHSDISAEYTFECSNQATKIKLPLWQLFPGVKSLTVNLVTEKGQQQLKLKSGQVLDLK